MFLEERMSNYRMKWVEHGKGMCNVRILMRVIVYYLCGKYLGRLWMKPRQSSSLPSNERLNRSVVLILCVMNVHDNLEVYAYFQFPCVICYFLCRYWMPHSMILWHLPFCGCPVCWNQSSGRLFETTLTSIITSSCPNILDLFC